MPAAATTCECPLCKLGTELVGPDDELVGKKPVSDGEVCVCVRENVFVCV